jgi:polysaccharide export outer membrane protein
MAALLLAAAFASAQVPGSAAAEPEYLISPDDVLEVYVLDVPELSRAYEVSATGKVTLPLLSAPLPAAGLTLEQFSQLARRRLQEEGFVSDPRVSTSVRESRAHAVAITGAVHKPQMYRVLGRTTLLDVLSQAEGVAEDAGTVAIIRRGDVAMAALQLRSPETAAAAPRLMTVDLERLLQKGDAAANVEVYPGDRIIVPRAGIVYVVGAVNRPGGFALKTGKQSITVLQALALAEDLKTTAVRNKAVIIHGDAKAAGGRQQIPVDLKKLLAGKTADPALEAEDILFVPDSSSRRVLTRSAEAVLQVATGLAIYRF